MAVEIPDTDAEGPGRRYAFWVQGCHFNCPGCCNQEYLPFQGGTTVSVSDLFQRISQAKDRFGIEGISVLGGEPFKQPKALADLLPLVKEIGLSVMIYTGYTLSELQKQQDPFVSKILHHTDLLVDGRYNWKLPDNRRRWIGSSNQQMHFLTDRYSSEDPCFVAGETVEFRLYPSGLVQINGWPSPKLEDIKGNQP